jgi:hypothetical protein
VCGLLCGDVSGLESRLIVLSFRRATSSYLFHRRPRRGVRSGRHYPFFSTLLESMVLPPCLLLPAASCQARYQQLVEKWLLSKPISRLGYSNPFLLTTTTDTNLL